jgi:hypothetical protein
MSNPAGPITLADSMSAWLRVPIAGLAAALLAGGCTFAPAAEEAPAPSLAAPLPAVTSAPATAGPAIAPLPTTEGEAILILRPGPGSRLTSPFRLSGEADATFEQTLGVRVLGMDGTQLASTSTTIASEAGQRGQFSLDLSLDVSKDTQVLIQVFSDSPRDGGLTHLASVGVLVTPAGPPQIVPAVVHPEDIQILKPASGQTVEGGVAHVEGFGIGTFESTLKAEVYDSGGNLVGSMPLIVSAPDMGQPGPFEVDIPYATGQAGPGRIVVRDQSPAFGGDVHLASVEINLAP